MDPLILLFIGIVVVIGGIVWLRLHAFIALFAAAIIVSSLTPRENIEQAALASGAKPEVAAARAQESLGDKLTSRFGSTCAQLGILIAMASIVGMCLLESGAADRIVRSMLSLFGEKRAPLVFASSGLILGVPVFFDTVFLLLIPLARAMALQTQRNFLLYVLAIAVGTTMTHSLVPPTPGPLLVAATLGVDLGMMIVAGLILSTMTASCGLAYAWWANRRWPAAPRMGGAEGDAVVTEVKLPAASELPPLWLSLLPIVLPVLLISGRTFASSELVNFSEGFVATAERIGHPSIALSIAAAVALIMLAVRRRGDDKPLRPTVQAALADAGTIILITAAGGVFGGVLQETGVGERIKDVAQAYRIGVLPLAFVVTALIRTAQGSATVAAVTSVGILAAFASPEALGFHPVYLALVIGCASKLVPWMNDSGFWVISKTSGLTEREMLRTISPMFTIMGVAGFIIVMIAAKLFPMV